MIIVADGPDLLCITQPDHAYFSGELLALWRADGVPDHPRREDLIFAAREHDNGWREADAAPRWNAGRELPHDFVSIPRQDRVAIWERGTARFAGQRPYAALLITRHALNLHRDRRGQEDWDDFLGSLDELERALFEATGASAEEVAADYRLVDLADLVSLAACNRWDEPFERYGLRGWYTDGTMHLDPLPLSGATTFTIPCRRIARRLYAGDAALGVELATARWQELRLRVAGPPSSGA
jgi:hypothetical protein